MIGLGAKIILEKLIDYDAASNVHGWQWSASTGTDAVPYFRMFNPTRQSERFDKDALYIKNIFLYSIMCPQNSYITHFNIKHN